MKNEDRLHDDIFEAKNANQFVEKLKNALSTSKKAKNENTSPQN